MVNLTFSQSYLGDTLLNRCFYSYTYEKYMASWFLIFFRWTEPHVLVSCCLVILLLLPVIFLVRPNDSYLKISRLYNVSRLSVLTFFHRVVYIYLIFCPFSFLINQQPPCFKAHSDPTQFLKLTYLPSAKYASFSFTLLYFSSLIFHSRFLWKISFIIILIGSGLHLVFSGELSIAQFLVTFSLSYSIHFYSLRVPFWILHLENIILPLVFISLFVLERDRFFQNDDALGRSISSLSLWISDFYMLGRYHCTRAGFVTVGRPIDLEWETDVKSSAYFSILSSEEEDVFIGNLTKDLSDSFISMILYLIGLIIRHYVSGPIKSSASGLI